MLSELLVAILIISVLAAVILPSYKRAVEKSRASQGISTLRNIAQAQNNYNAKRGKYSKTILPLSLDMKDIQGNDVRESAFADKYFDYAVYGDNKKISIARRKTGEYELRVNYDTGKICCKTQKSSICSVLNIEDSSCDSNIIWEECDGRLNEFFNKIAGVEYDNEGNSNSCKITFGNDRLDFEICTPHLAVYKFGLSSSGISGKCFKGYFSTGEENKIVYTYCKELQQCNSENCSASIYYIRDDSHVVVHCPKYNFEEETCVNTDPKQQRMYKYINKHNPDLFVQESSAYCNEFDDTNMCTDIKCLSGDCDFY